MQRELKWLEKSVIYEIYPQSFLDSNGDGIGDIGGIAEKLDYIADLGCNVIWINACSESEFCDGGYDVTDYYRVAQRYGSNEEMRELFEKAHEKGMRILLDFVPGHTSNQHPWFREFSENEGEGYNNRYIWIPETYDVSKEEEHVAALEGARKGHYVANFFDFQPALNYGYANPDPDKPWQLSPEHPQVQSLIGEMTEVIKFWLDMGADGLRVDMAASLVKHDTDSVMTGKIWKNVRTMMDKEYPHAVLLSEWSDPKVSIPAGFHMDFMIHVNGNAYTSLFRNEHGRNINPGDENGRSFFDKEGEGDIREFLDDYMEQYEKTKGKGYICIPSGNHDIPRLCFGRDTEDLKVCFTFLLMLPGIPVLYYGDEIGMSHRVGLEDKEGGKLSEEEYTNRTGARTPMQWNSGKNAGFSGGKEENLYLPVGEEYREINVESEILDENSLLNHIKQLMKLRHREAALEAAGEFAPIYAKKYSYPFVFERRCAEKRFWIVVNPANRAEKIELPDEGMNFTKIMGKGVAFDKEKNQISLRCNPVSYGIFQAESSHC